MRKIALYFIGLMTLCGLLFQPVHSEAKLSRADRKKFGTPFQMLSFDQVAKLEMNQRIRYVRQMRKSFRELERTQYSLGRKVAFYPTNQTEGELYALIFGQRADAQDSSNQGRGLYTSDQCIFGYQLSKYPKAGEIQPGMCEIPASARCQGISGAGVQCGYEVSGLRKDDKGACIPSNIRYKATEECDRVRQQRIDENGPAIRAAIDKAKAHFKVGDDQASIKKSALLDAEGMGALRDLLNHAYDDETYAHMLWVLSLYKKEGINVDFAKLDPAFEGLNLNRFAGAFNNSQIKLNKAFQDYVNHCESNVDSKVLNALSRPEWAREIDKLAQGGDSWWQREQKRIEVKTNFDRVKNCENAPNTGDCAQLRRELSISPEQKIEYKVKNVLEVPECKAMAARYDKIRETYDRIAGSFPAVDPDQPASEPAPPPKPETPSHIATATGCSRRVTRDKDLLAQASAQCLICAAEKSVMNTADSFTPGTKEHDDRAYNTVSRKWMSLMSTMVLACGDGKEGAPGRGALVDVPNMLLYMQTYGHCDANKYEWNPDEKALGSRDRGLLEKWQTNQSYWAGLKDKKPAPDVETDFTRIYGLKYTTATKLFCDKDRFKKGWFGRLKKLDTKTDRKGVEDFMRSSRESFRSARKVVRPDRAEHTAANALLECMDQATERADELYVQGSGQCLAATDTNVASSSQVEAFRDSAFRADQGLVIYNNSACNVHHVNETDTARGNSRSGFAYPAGIPEGTSPYARITIANAPRGQRLADVATHRTGGGTADATTVLGDLAVNGFGSFTYVSDAGCPVPAGIGQKSRPRSTSREKK